MKKITANGNYNNYVFSKRKDKVVVKGLKGVRVGQMVSFTVEICLSKPHMEKDDAVVVGTPSGFSLPQFSRPEREAYTTFSSNSKATLRMEHLLNRERFVQIVVKDGVLRAGEKIKVCFGDRKGGGPGVRVPYQKAGDVLVAVYRLHEARLLSHSPRIDIESQSFNTLRCHVTSTFRKGKPVKLTFVAEDAYGNGCEDFGGEIRFLNRNISKDLPGKVVIKAKDKGRKQISFVPQHVDSFRVCCECRGVSLLSNPCVRLDDSFSYNLYFGEIHAHSELSYDASGSLDELYTYARDTGVLDFAAATDHQTGVKNLSGPAPHSSSLSIFDMGDMPFRWKMTCQKAKDYNKPGRFVTFPAFELVPSGLSGHRNLYFLKDNPEMIKVPNKWSGWGGEDVLNPYLKKHKVLVIHHHPAISWDAGVNTKGKGLVFSDVPAEYQPAVEIYSKHGCSEYFGTRRPLRGQILGYFVSDMLGEGHRFGFTAGSDTHQGNPGSSMIDSGPFSTLQYRNGLVAIWAKELKRESLWEAIFARRMYATSYNKTLIFFYVNNLFMGRQGVIKGPRFIRLKVLSATKVIKVELIKNNRTVYATCKNVPIPDMEVEYTDRERSGIDEDFYYARITESEGDIVWSSPVWVRTSSLLA